MSERADPAVVPASDRTPERKWRPALGFVALMLGLPVSGFAATAATSSVPVPPIVVADDVEVTPPTTWEFVQRSDDFVILSNGSATLAVAVDRSMDSAGLALASYLAQMQADALQFFSGDAIAFELPAHEGTRAPYWAVFSGVAYPTEGEVTAVPLPDGGVVLFDAWSDEGVYATHRDAVDSIILTSRLGR